MQIAALERAGWWQETYDVQRDIYHEWNEGVLTHKWTFKNDRCAQCLSEGLCVTVGRFAVCKKCLTEYPNVPWHPTGEIRPKWTAFLTHSVNCPIHEPSTSSKPSTEGATPSQGSPSVSD